MSRPRIQQFKDYGWHIYYFDTMNDARKKAIDFLERKVFSGSEIRIWRGSEWVGIVKKIKYPPYYQYEWRYIDKNGIYQYNWGYLNKDGSLRKK